ncbi:Crp/Fnr family transcriptional regulator [Panacibacter ginsenosidivorans]|uniref:Crp/Fnr family transcriptional regulator n=1 Tax=Panacibacter ginsenosidivorans TaxID=1813871 RepID=A0A5B8VBN2_9BACT|nr:Crp/Fnr family transcriptional regulator [Panacibacter ginsenosidivorans]QEC68927.1 Crp/Fnr family transcriptional regulator [Panacibacter ginsenosidivorans]
MKESKKHCDLESCMMCRLCIKEWKPAMEANRKNFHYKKGELLFKEGEELKGVYFINEGTVKVHKQWGDKELILRFARKGAIAGHRGLGGDMLYSVSATALEPVNVCYVDLDFFKSTMKVNHDFMYELMMFFASELKESERNMRNLVHMPVKGRIAQALFTLKEKFGVKEDGSIDIELSRQDFASFVGTTYETVFRMLNELLEDKLLKVDGKNITILDREKLMELTKH